MATRVLLEIKFLELQRNIPVKFEWNWLSGLWGYVVKNKSLRKYHGRTPDEKRSQTLTMSLCDRWVNKAFLKIWHHDQLVLIIWPIYYINSEFIKINSVTNFCWNLITLMLWFFEVVRIKNLSPYINLNVLNKYQPFYLLTLQVNSLFDQYRGRQVCTA
jgi:hypothetical protein